LLSLPHLIYSRAVILLGLCCVLAAGVVQGGPQSEHVYIYGPGNYQQKCHPRFTSHRETVEMLLKPGTACPTSEGPAWAPAELSASREPAPQAARG
jgi:hypothetical protein